MEMVKFVEIWSSINIEDVKPYYLISNYGRIYSLYSNTFIIPHENHSGYLQASLMTNTGRVFRKVHRLVLLSFNYFAGCEELQVNHKDGNKSNNCLWNLEWVTPKENIAHAVLNNLRSSKGENNPRSVLTEKDVKSIVSMVLEGLSTNDIANILGCSPSEIRSIINGSCWNSVLTKEEISLMKNARCYMDDNTKHNICLYYQNNKGAFDSIKELCINALLSSNFEINDKSLRIAKRLYYRYQNPEITYLYNY